MDFDATPFYPSAMWDDKEVKEEVKKIEGNRMRSGYNIDTLTSVDIQETVEIGK